MRGAPPVSKAVRGSGARIFEEKSEGPDNPGLPDTVQRALSGAATD